MQQKQRRCSTPVLLVCVYNKSGNIITHDLLCQLFSEYGEVQRVLIFEKAKVWKTFVEMESPEAANIACEQLNNRAIFPDGSKMNIFPSTLRQISFQNSNLGGVDYCELKKSSPGEVEEEEPVRIRSHTHWAHTIFEEDRPKSVVSDLETKESPKKSVTSNVSLKSSTDLIKFSVEEDSDSPPKIRKRQESWNNWCDIDAQFRELALESEDYREMVSSSIRPKSKSIIPVNPFLEQYLLENSPSKVLFVRSIPAYHTIRSIYNIMLNFGNIRKIVNIKHKQSMLVEYEHIEDACQSKDFLNSVKNGMRIFYSHYQTLLGRKIAENQECEEYIGSHPKKENFNPPSEVLHITYLPPELEEDFFLKVRDHGEIVHHSWQKLSNINKWMLLIKMKTMEDSLKVMGFLQNFKVGKRNVKISFTRSKLES